MKKLIILLVSVMSAATAFAVDVPVTDNISVDTTWTKDNAYIIGAPIFVTDDAVLTIEPGTTVYFFEDPYINMLNFGKRWVYKSSTLDAILQTVILILMCYKEYIDNIYLTFI